MLVLAATALLAAPNRAHAQDEPSASLGASQSGEFAIALTGKYPPFSYYDSQGQLTGFDVDTSQEVADRLGRDLKIVPTEWAGILAGLLAGRYDAIIGSMGITPARQEKVDFSDPYYISGAQLFIAKDEAGQITSIEDLTDGGRVGVTIGSTYEQYLTENYPTIEVIARDGEPAIFQDMDNDRIDAFVTDKLVGMYRIKAAGMPYVPAGPLLYDEEVGIPIQKGQPELLAAINAALADMRADGTFDELHAKYFGAEPGTGAGTQKIGAPRAAEMLLKGFLLTLAIAGLSLGLGFLISIPLGLVLFKGHGPLFFVVRGAVDFLRGTPALVQLFFVYAGAPQIGLTLPAWMCAVIALTANAAAYMAEVVRAGLMAVPAGQGDAGRALGLTRVQTFRFVVWPQAFRVAVPPLMNSTVALLKDTTLIAFIGVAEVFYRAQSIISVNYDPMLYYFIVGVLFFLVTFPLMKAAERYERRIKAKGFTNA